MVEVETWGKVKGLNQGKRFLGLFSPRMTVRCYAVDGLLVDSGPDFSSRSVLDFVRANGIHSAVITHHHEDHSGNCRTLAESDQLKVYASTLTGKILAKGFARPLYQRLVWGNSPRTDRTHQLPSLVETEHHRFEIIEAPGHCEDQIVLFERREGWLFTGDAFLSNRVKHFRADEDFNRMLATVQKLSLLPVQSVFCAHHPVPAEGSKSLREKLAFMLELREEVSDLYHRQGRSIAEITAMTLGREDWTMFLLSRGDFCKRNVIKSILQGPTPRKEFSGLIPATPDEHSQP